MEILRRGSGRFGVSFEYKKRDGNWAREIRYFQDSAIRDKAMKSIKRHPYNWRVKKVLFSVA